MKIPARLKKCITGFLCDRNGPLHGGVKGTMVRVYSARFKRVRILSPVRNVITPEYLPCIAGNLVVNESLLIHTTVVPFVTATSDGLKAKF